MKTKCLSLINNYHGKIDFLRVIAETETERTLKSFITDQNLSFELDHHSESTNFSVFSIKDKREFFFASNDLDFIEEEIQESIKNITKLPEDSYSIIPETKKLSFVNKNNFLKVNGENKSQEIYEFIKKHYRAYVNNFKGEMYLSMRTASDILIDSNGFTGEETSEECNISLEISTEVNGIKFNAWTYLHLTNEKEYESFVLDLLEELQLKTKAKPIITGNYNCIFKPAIAASIINTLVKSLLSASNIDNKSSCWKDKLGEKVLNEKISIIEDPNAYYKMPYDIESFPLKKKYIIQNGAIKTFLNSQKLAKKLNQPLSGNAISGLFSHLIIQSSDPFNIEDFSGVVINNIISHNFNNSTGEFKASCEGYEILKGKKTPFNNAVVVFSLENLMNANISNETPSYHSRIFTSSLLIDNLTIAGE